jgi:ABC-type glycerol-3-phosphate transport system substrate-binding protein
LPPAATSRRRAVLGRGLTAVVGGGALPVLAACGGPAAPAAPAGAGGGRQNGAAKLVAMLRSSQQELDGMTKTIAAFETKFPQVTVDKVIATTDAPYDVKTDALTAAGTPPALWFPAANRGYRYYAALKQTEVLDDLIARDKYDLSTFVAPPLAFCKWEGKYNCLPIETIPQILVWNETLFQSSGAAAPSLSWQDKNWNWDTFMAAAQKITRPGDVSTAQFGAVMNNGRFADQTHGGDFFDDPAYDGGYPNPSKFPANRPAVEEAWTFLHDLIYRSHVQPTSAENSQVRGALPNVFFSGRIGMMATTTGFLASANQIQNFKMRLAAFPAPAALARRNWFYADQWVIMRGQSNRDAAWELLKHMSSIEAHRTYALPLGWMSAHKTLVDEWVKFQKDYTGIAEADLKMATDAVAVSRITPSHALVNYGMIWSDAIDPDRVKLFNNEESVKAALDAIVPLALNVIKETNPK